MSELRRPGRIGWGAGGRASGRTERSGSQTAGDGRWGPTPSRRARSSRPPSPDERTRSCRLCRSTPPAAPSGPRATVVLLTGAVLVPLDGDGPQTSRRRSPAGYLVRADASDLVATGAFGVVPTCPSARSLSMAHHGRPRPRGRSAGRRSAAVTSSQRRCARGLPGVRADGQPPCPVARRYQREGARACVGLLARNRTRDGSATRENPDGRKWLQARRRASAPPSAAHVGGTGRRAFARCLTRRRATLGQPKRCS
jgi:hypothetical protein